MKKKTPSNDFFTIIDVNINRASEGLRVAEEIARHVVRSESVFVRIREIRHQIQSIAGQYPGLVLSRQSQSDPGRAIPAAARQDLAGIISANLKRAQEALRVLEEVQEKDCAGLRFAAYDIERDLLSVISRSHYGLDRMGVYVVAEEPDELIRACKQGVRIAQLRSKTACARDIIDMSARVITAIQTMSPRPIFIINDRPDLAKLIGADGVHIGQDDMSIAQAREILGQALIVGKSTHNIEQALAAQQEGADYISVGPLWETPTKPGRPAAGIKYLQQAAQRITIPFVAIGGIDMSNIDQVWSAGARNIAVVRAVSQLPDLMRKVL